MLPLQSYRLCVVLQVPVDSSSIAYGRTPSEVIAIVTAGKGKGLFFPDGLNGKITV